MSDVLDVLNKALGGVKVPEVMHGDNLSIVLCTAFDDDGEIQESGWTLAAEDGCEKTLQAIRAHYQQIADLPATDAQIKANPEVQALVEALQWYADETNWEQTSAANDDPHDGRIRDFWNGDFADGWAIARAALAALEAPVRCAECDCKNGGTDCNWIAKP